MSEESSHSKFSVAIIGAGPAGLTAAHELTLAGHDVTVLERDPEYVGGISKTVRHNGYHFDIGGHRFFSKAQEVEDFWRRILPDDFLDRPRKSRIFYKGQLFSYPLKPMDALTKLGFFESIRCVLSYGLARLKPIPQPRNFEEWVINQFGRRLFSIFFKTYTEKVWGMKCTEISADWAAQRIKGLSMSKAILNAIYSPKPKDRGAVIKTLIDSFRYPRRGPGMMWERASELVTMRGGRVVMDRTVTSCGRDPASGRWRIWARDASGADHSYEADHVISSMAMAELVAALEPAPAPAPAMARAAPAPAMARAAKALRYRDFLVVALVINEREQFDDNWIYIHEPHVKVGRIQNFKSWSPEMVPEEGRNCYGLEYFCFEGDSLWESADEDLVALASDELATLGLASRDDILDGHVVRQEKAYPVYDETYQENVDAVRAGIERDYPNLHLVGRNGMHKYNNQDHAIMTAMLTVQNILAGKQLYDVWRVNQDAEYHEAGEASAESALGASGERMVPRRVS